MNCERARVLIDAYVDGELGAPERALIESHLETCAECMKVRRQVEQMTESSRAFEAISPDLRERIRYEIARPHSSPMSRMKEKLMTKNGMRFGAATIAVALVLGAAAILSPKPAMAGGAAMIKKMRKAAQGVKAVHEVSYWNMPDGTEGRVEIWTDGKDLHVDRLGHLEIIYKGKFYYGGKDFPYEKYTKPGETIAVGQIDPEIYSLDRQIMELSRGKSAPVDHGFGTLNGLKVRVVSIVNQEGTERHTFYVDAGSDLPIRDVVEQREGNGWKKFGYCDYEFLDSIDPDLFKNLPPEVKTHD